MLRVYTRPAARAGCRLSAVTADVTRRCPRGAGGCTRPGTAVPPVRNEERGGAGRRPRQASRGEGAARWGFVGRGHRQLWRGGGEEQPPRALPARGPGTSDALGRSRRQRRAPSTAVWTRPLLAVSARPRAAHGESSVCLPKPLWNVARTPPGLPRRGAEPQGRRAPHISAGPRPPSSSPSAAPEAAVRGPHSYRESFSHTLFNCSLLETIRLTVLWSESRVAAGNPLYEFFQQNTMLTYAGPTKQIRTWWAGPQGNRTRVPLGEWHRPEEAVLGASGVLAWAAAARTGTGSGHLSPHQAGTPTPLAQHVMCHS